jgi:methylase of polypeptide subunit release factors
LLEIGHRQGSAVEALLLGAGLREVTIEQDLTGRDRFAVARRSEG